MNKFVIFVEREYDCYTVDMPYPLMTTKTKEEIQEELWELAFQAIVDGVVKDSLSSFMFMGIKIFHENFCGQIIGNKPINGKYRFKKRIPEVLTFEEWCEK